jgi:hypothetical protein
VKRPEGIKNHQWEPSDLPPQKKTKLTFYALGAMQPGKESKATINSNDYEKLPEDLAESAEECTGLAWEKFPRIPPKFLTK